MLSMNDLAIMESHPLTAELALFLLGQLEEQTIDEMYAGFVGRLTDYCRSSAGGVVFQQGRRWETLAWVGDSIPIPDSLVADAVDGGTPVATSEWRVAPLASESSSQEVILLFQPEAEARQVSETLRMASQIFAMASSISRRQREATERTGRLDAMLDVAAQWHQETDSEALLRSIADAATDLLGAERASIFLWDRARKKLIGKPALGIEADTLEVDDTSGVVGTVLRTGQPHRWQATDDDEAEINRSIDQKLNFQTRSLVAVPLENQQGKRAGVFEVINKNKGPFSLEDVETLSRLAVHASGAIRNTNDRIELKKNRDRLVQDAARHVQIVGASAPIAALQESVGRVAATELAVLILGENGTGKEVVARNIHYQSPRSHEPFVAVNCAALVETLLESELFGHEKGAFTDAHQARPGKFESAHGGTLFLDEIGDMSPTAQAKLLRVLEDKVVVRVGGSTPISVNVRVLAATNQPLAELIAQKKFREDLYFRLNVVSIRLPPLRDRGNDIMVLSEHFLQEFAMQIGRQPPTFSTAARNAILSHRWPGNVRELRNLMERVSYLCPQEELQVEDLAFLENPRSKQADSSDEAAQDEGVAATLNEATRRFQVTQIRQAIDACMGNMTDAAARLGLHRSNLYRKMRQLGMEVGPQD